MGITNLMSLSSLISIVCPKDIFPYTLNLVSLRNMCTLTHTHTCLHTGQLHPTGAEHIIFGPNPECWRLGYSCRHLYPRVAPRRDQADQKETEQKREGGEYESKGQSICLVVSDGTSYAISYGSLMSFLKSQWSRRLQRQLGRQKCQQQKWQQRKLRRPERTQTHTHIHFLWHDGIYEMSFLWIVLWSYGYLMSFMESHWSRRRIRIKKSWTPSASRSTQLTLEPVARPCVMLLTMGRARPGISVSLCFMYFLVSYVLSVYGCLRYLLFCFYVLRVL